MSIQEMTCALNTHSPNEMPQTMIKLPNFLFYPIAEFLLNEIRTPVVICYFTTKPLSLSTQRFLD